MSADLPPGMSSPLVDDPAPAPTRNSENNQNETADPQEKDGEKKNKKKEKRPRPPPVRRYRPYAPLDHAARVYAKLAMSLVVPVTITMFIIVWAVQSLTPVDNTNPTKTGVAAGPATSVDPAFVVVKESPDKSTGENIGGALVNMLIVVGAITVITFLMVLLYKYGYVKVLYVWLAISAALVFFFLSALFFDLVATRYQIPYDWVVFSLLVWNFGVAGILSVFYMAHPLVSQGYLVVVSVIVTWGLTQTPEWTTWAILVGVAIYDILAVLCPKGPLHLLVKAAQERQEPIPGFIYDSDGGPAVELMQTRAPVESRPDSSSSSSRNAAATSSSNNNDKDKKKKDAAEKKDGNTSASNNNNDDDNDDLLGGPRPVNPMAALDSANNASSRSVPTTRTSQEDIDLLLGDGPAPAAAASSSSGGGTYGTAAANNENGNDGDHLENSTSHSAWTAAPFGSSSVKESASGSSTAADGVVFTQAKNQSNGEDEKKDEGGEKKEKKKKKKAESSSDSEEEEVDPFEAAHHATPFKLGLGDFIFYSLLVGRAAMSVKTSQTPWLVCYIFIIAGMGATLASLLFLRGKVPALPALPFSIFAATIAFFITRYVTTPYWDLLTVNAYTP